MSVIRYVSPIFIVVLCCDIVQAQSIEGSSKQKTVVDAIKSVHTLKMDSYHRFLRESTLAVSLACNFKPWDEVVMALDNQMCPLVSSRGIGGPPNDSGKRLDRHYLARSNAVKLLNGQWLDAHIAISVRYDNGKDAERNTNPGVAHHARVVLFDEINAKTSDFDKNRYQKDSILDLVIRSEEVTEEMKKWAFVKSVSVDYGSLTLITRQSGDGFDVTVEFAESIEKDINGSRIHFLSYSGLGPVMEKLPKGFKPKDTLTPVYCYARGN